MESTAITQEEFTIQKEELTKTIVTLSNGKRVANFSSPHSFTFTDGTVLPAVSDNESERLKVTFIEDVDRDGDVKLSFKLSTAVFDVLEMWEELYDELEVDVVYCPLPMITALKDMRYDIKKSPFRSVRIEDRIKKLVSIEKQCI